MYKRFYALEQTTNSTTNIVLSSTIPMQITNSAVNYTKTPDGAYGKFLPLMNILAIQFWQNFIVFLSIA